MSERRRARRAAKAERRALECQAADLRSADAERRHARFMDLEHTTMMPRVGAESDRSDVPCTPEKVRELLDLLAKGTASVAAVQKVFPSRDICALDKETLRDAERERAARRARPRTLHIGAKHTDNARHIVCGSSGVVQAMMRGR